MRRFATVLRGCFSGVLFEGFDKMGAVVKGENLTDVIHGQFTDQKEMLGFFDLLPGEVLRGAESRFLCQFSPKGAFAHGKHLGNFRNRLRGVEMVVHVADCRVNVARTLCRCQPAEQLRQPCLDQKRVGSTRVKTA